jgi:hypothetical protein
MNKTPLPFYRPLLLLLLLLSLWICVFSVWICVYSFLPRLTVKRKALKKRPKKDVELELKPYPCVGDKDNRTPSTKTPPGGQAEARVSEKREGR